MKTVTLESQPWKRFSAYSSRKITKVEQDMAEVVDKEKQKLSKWATKVLHLLQDAKDDGVHLKVKGGLRGPFKLEATIVEPKKR